MPVATVALGARRIIVGTLHFEADGRRQFSAFTYDPAWLENRAAFALCPALPLQAGTFYASGREDARDALAGCFADASPDSWGRGLMIRALGGGLTEFDYLTRSDDATRQGALRFLGEDGEPISGIDPEVPRRMEIEALREVSARYERDPAGAEEAARVLAGAAGSLGGARPKANVTDGEALWIAKFTSVLDTKPVERVEVGTLALARLAGLRAAEAELALPGSDHPVALIKRFDRRSGGRVPYISARTALQASGTEPGYYSDIADAIRVISHDAQRDLTELWQRIVFTILVGNTDDHLKNHGFLYVRDGLWQLSPAFDINPQPQRHRHMETGISPLSGFEPSIGAAIEHAPFFGLDETEARKRAAAMAQIVHAQWKPCLRAQGLRGSTLAAYAPAFEHGEMENALGLAP